MRKRHAAVAAATTAILFLAAIALSACGGDSDGSSGTQGATNPGAAPSPVSLEIAETDDGFEPAAVSVERGQLVHVTFANKGKVIHNLRIAGSSGQFGGAGDFVLGDPVVQPGQKASGDWQAPAQAGRRPFRCDAHPNHTGVITIK
jgi:plastocyanin